MIAYLTVGPSCCGKSTWANKFIKEHPRNILKVERDEIRFNLFCGGIRDWSRYKFNRANENRVSEYQNQAIERAASHEFDLVLSDTWLNEKYRLQMKEKLRSLGYSIRVKDDWQFSWDDLVKRNITRLGGISTSILWKQYQNWLDYNNEPRYKINHDLPKAIICDIDGTIASHDGVRDVFDFDNVDKDKPIVPVVCMIKGLIDSGYHVLFFSGRSDVCKAKTESWLKSVFPKHIHHTSLFMREEGDFRRDSIVKTEMFWKYAAPNYAVEASVDDRNTVVRETWGHLGIKCIHVGHMYEEF